MVESQREATQGLRDRCCARNIVSPRAALKKGYGFLKGQDIKRNLIGQFAPVRESRRDEHARPSGWQQVRNVLRCGDIVVDEEPCRALLSKPTQSCLGGLLDISFG